MAGGRTYCNGYGSSRMAGGAKVERYAVATDGDPHGSIVYHVLERLSPGIERLNSCKFCGVSRM